MSYCKPYYGFFTEIGLEVLPWPENSPDLNPIEGVWHNLKERVNEVISPNRRDLMERIIQAWHQNRDINTLIERYMQACQIGLQRGLKLKVVQPSTEIRWRTIRQCMYMNI